MGGTQDEVVPLHAPYEVVFRGFNRQQVLDHVESLEGRLLVVAADRDAALQQVADLSKLLDHLRREAEEAAGRAREATARAQQASAQAQEATTRLERLQRSSLGGVGARIQRMMQVAEDEIAELQATAQLETTALRERTQAEADRLLQETKQRCERLEAESERRRKAVEADSAARCKQAELESEHRRKQAEQQSEREIARREAEASARIREHQTRAVTGLHLMLILTGQQLHGRLSEAEGEVERLKELRAEITTRLSSAHRMLIEALGQVQQPTGVEHNDLSGGSPGPGRAQQPTAGSRLEGQRSGRPPVHREPALAARQRANSALN